MNPICLRSCGNASTTETKDGPVILCGRDDAFRKEGAYCPYKDNKPAEPPDMVNQPPHYRHGDIECIDAIESAVTDLTGKEAVLTGQIIRYVWRWKWKNGVEDLRKAKFYLSRLIKHLEAQNGDG